MLKLEVRSHEVRSDEVRSRMLEVLKLVAKRHGARSKKS